MPDGEDPGPSFPGLRNDEVPLTVRGRDLDEAEFHLVGVEHEQRVGSEFPVEAAARVGWLGLGQCGDHVQIAPFSSDRGVDESQHQAGLAFRHAPHREGARLIARGGEEERVLRRGGEDRDRGEQQASPV